MATLVFYLSSSHPNSPLSCSLLYSYNLLITLDTSRHFASFQALLDVDLSFSLRTLELPRSGEHKRGLARSAPAYRAAPGTSLHLPSFYLAHPPSLSPPSFNFNATTSS
jgi:hypothetical protein